MMRFWCLLVCQILIVTPAFSQDTAGSTEEPQPLEPPNSTIPLVAISCAYKEKLQSFSVGFEANKDIFRLVFQECSIWRSNADAVFREPSYTFNIPIELHLNRRADVSKCNNFSIASMVELKDTNPEFDWSGLKRVIADVEVTNVGGTSMNFSHFALHEKVGVTGVTLANSFFSGNDLPNYDDVFFGELNLTGLERLGKVSKFGNELARVTPVVGKGEGKIDYTLNMQARLFAPRAVCYERVADGPAKAHNLIVTRK